MTNLDTAAARAAWLTETVVSIPADSRELLESYSHIAPNAVIPHVIAQRNAAFEIFPYPCIGQLRFLSLNLSTHPLYPTILARLRQGDTLLDVGCCFGQDIRKAVYDGAPAENIAGLDVDQGFVDLGYSLFRDSKTLKSSFTVADMLDPGSSLDKLEGRMDIISIVSFLHLWDWENQVKAAKHLVSLSKSKAGSVIVGRQLGSAVAGEFPDLKSSLSGVGTNYRHDVASFERLWKQVGSETNSKWNVEASLYEGGLLTMNKGQKWAEPNMRMILFTVTRE